MEPQLTIMNNKLNELQQPTSADIVNNFFKSNINNTRDIQVLDEIRQSMVQNNLMLNKAIAILSKELQQRGQK